MGWLASTVEGRKGQSLSIGDAGFLLRKTLQPDYFDYEMLNEELDLLDEDEFKHLEKEFENYQTLHPLTG